MLIQVNPLSPLLPSLFSFLPLFMAACLNTQVWLDELVSLSVSSLGNCAHFQKGGWWYHMCAHSNLNGVWYRGGHYRSRYQDGVYWAEFHGGSYSLKTVTMMIKPT